MSEDNIVTPVLPPTIPSEEFNGILNVLSEKLDRLREEKSAPRTSYHLKKEPETADVPEVSVEQDSEVDPETKDSDEGEETSSSIRKTRTIEILMERVRMMLNWFSLDETEDPPLYRLRKPRHVCPNHGKYMEIFHLLTLGLTTKELFYQKNFVFSRKITNRSPKQHLGKFFYPGKLGNLKI